ncbi:MAG: hypothetical protein EZS28_002750 [Streblomastix strix]|uniref:Uncharacterized protein n=1 Tax=Streblomastix strix TaxID=222440 RepID=A0A5J4X4L0_9EUKA|nr:MAG: hypothetical protein EZS28_002750 [Streblomastix strix]
MINNAPAPDVHTRPEANEIFDTKADKTDTYTKIETDTLLDDKADKTELIDSYSKKEDDALLLLKANIVDIVDSYSKTETDTLLDAKANVADIVDSYSKTDKCSHLHTLSYQHTPFTQKQIIFIGYTDQLYHYFKHGIVTLRQCVRLLLMSYIFQDQVIDRLKEHEGLLQ